MTDIHPDVQAALDMARDLRNQIADLRERVDTIRARRPSPGGGVIPEIDAMGRLTDLYLAPGTAAHHSNEELVAEIMAAIKESTADAARQQQVVMDTMPSFPPTTDSVAEQRAEAETDDPTDEADTTGVLDATDAGARW